MHYQATKESLDTHTIPEWYSDAKFGIFIHWGLYSLPAFAERNPSYNFQSFMHDLMTCKTVEAGYHMQNGICMPSASQALQRQGFMKQPMEKMSRLLRFKSPLKITQGR